MTIVILLAAHWSLAAFVQSSFHHRYASHRMFSLTPRGERLFHLFAYLVQGSSYLSPRAYGSSSIRPSRCSVSSRGRAPFVCAPGRSASLDLR